MGCLLLHHLQQMPCNIHAVTAIVSVNEQAGVWSKEQRRVAAAIYPTASLMNHACDPDVIVRYGISAMFRLLRMRTTKYEFSHWIISFGSQ